MILKSESSSDILIRTPEKERDTMNRVHLNTNDLNRISVKAINEGIHVNKKAWSKIIALFNRSLIPSNDQSREMGAGAGLMDTD